MLGELAKKTMPSHPIGAIFLPELIKFLIQHGIEGLVQMKSQFLGYRWGFYSLNYPRCSKWNSIEYFKIYTRCGHLYFEKFFKN